MSVSRAPERWALLVVPRDWRDGVARDLRDERVAGGTLSFVLCALVIGLRLRAARARDAFGGRGRTGARVALGKDGPMRSLDRDVRLAIRGAIRRPAHALAVIATLAIGIGASTAIFSVFNWILFRPLPGVVRPDELVTVSYQHPKSPGNFWASYRDYADLRDGVSAFTGLTASQPVKMDVRVDVETERLDGEIVTASYFDVFGVPPMRGRAFSSAEERSGANPVVVISRRLWRRLFDANPAALGRRVSIEGKPFTVIGIAPAAFQGRSKVTVTDLWIPIGAYTTLQPSSAADLFTRRRETMFGDAFGRLRPGTSLAQAQEEALAVAAAVPDFLGRSPGVDVRTSIQPVIAAGVGNQAFTEDRLATIFWLLMGAVGVLLLLACANAANLLLARGTQRRREIAVCQAIGASRVRIIREQLVEGLVLALIAGAAGVVLAFWFVSLFDGMRLLSFLPAVSSVGLDLRVGAFALGAAIVTAVVFATIPSIVTSRVDLQASLKDGLTSVRHGRHLLRSSLVTLQVTLAVLLLASAGLFLRTLHNMRALDLGADVEHVVSLSVQPSRYGYDDQRSQAYIHALLHRLRHTPGIEAAAFTWTTTFSANRSELTFAPAGASDQKITAGSSTVTRGFFDTMGIALLAGRDFRDDEMVEHDKEGVIILGRRLAEQLFPHGGAIGSRLVLRYPKGKVVEVIGVVGDVRGRALRNEPPLFAYQPAGEPTWGTIQVRSTLPTAQTIAAVRDAARAVDPLVMPYDVEPFQAAIDRALAEERLFARLSSLFAAIGAMLAGIGIYGMMSGSVAERRREFGIRMALGARATSVVGLVLRTSVLIGMIGVLLGIGAAAGVRGVLESRLFGVTGLDAETLAVTAVAVVLLSVLAAFVPAARAARIDPMRSLRVD